MAHVAMALAVTTLLLAFVGSVSAQDSALCLGDGLSLLTNSCPDYLSEASATPDLFCCSTVSDLSIIYGTDCLCQIVLQQQASPTPDVNSGREASLATVCDSGADMSKCATPALAPAAVASPPPPSSSVSAPDIFLPPPPPPRGSTPAFGVPSTSSSASSSKGSSASKTAIVGGSVAGGGVGILGLLYALVKYLPQFINVNIDYDLNKPCCCCHRRHDKPENIPAGPVPAAPYPAHPHVPPPVQHWRPHLGAHHWV